MKVGSLEDMKAQSKDEQDVGGDVGDDVLEAAIGAWGRWQAWLSFLMSLLKLPIAWFQLIILFMAPPGQFSCASEWANASQPVNASGPCTSYHHDRSVFTETIISEWDLVGERHHLASLAQVVFMLGVLIGNIVFGAMADRFGRKGPLMIAIVLQSVSGIATAIVPWFTVFLILRFLLATATGGIMVVSFVICMESVGGRWRTIVPILYQIPFSLGLILMVGAASLLRHWRQLQLALSTSTLLFIAYGWLIQESPRWLLAMGRDEEAAVILKSAAIRNGLSTARVDRALKHFAEERKALNADSNSPRAEPTAGALFRTPQLRKNTLLLVAIWFATGMGFFGFSQFQGQLGGNVFANVAIGGLAGIPGPLLCVPAVQRFGRRNTLFLSLFTSGASLMLVGALPDGSTNHNWGRVVLAGISSFGLSVSFPALYLFSGELFPTVVRNAGLGLGSMSARLGSMIAPFVVALGIHGEAIPPVVLGLLPIVAVFLVFPLPETRGCVLPETIEDAEMFCPKTSRQDARNANYIRAPTSMPTIDENC